MMRIFRLTTLVAPLACAAFLVVGCTTKPEAVSTAPPPAAAPAPMPSAPPPAPIARGPLPGSAEDFRVNVGDTVHFAYNEYGVQDNDKSTLQKQADWLGRYPGVRVTIEGHADERGTREYNIALGARRAQSVRTFLASRGIDQSRMRTISYGKERPVAVCNDISCWSQNRRAVTVLNASS